jgi:hypothetical protein
MPSLKNNGEYKTMDICQTTDKQNTNMNKLFKITSVAKADILYVFEDSDNFEKIKIKIENMDDGDMEELASKLADDYCEQLFWDSLKIIFELRFLE